MRMLLPLLTAITLWGCTADIPTVQITWSGDSVAIVNPCENQGVSVIAQGADVITTNESDRVVRYKLSGHSDDGSFRLYSSCRQELLLAGLELTCSDNPAIDIQSHKKTWVVTERGTSNVLSDGYEYIASDEDRKAAFFSEGQLVFRGNGALHIQGHTHHALCSDDYIAIESGTLTIDNPALGADGIHAKDYFLMSGGEVTIHTTADGDTLRTDSTLTAYASNCIESKGAAYITEGTLTLTNTGRGGKGLNVADSLVIGAEDNRGPVIHITTEGRKVGEDFGMMPPPDGFPGGPDGGFADVSPFPPHGPMEELTEADSARIAEFMDKMERGDFDFPDHPADAHFPGHPDFGGPEEQHFPGGPEGGFPDGFMGGPDGFGPGGPGGPGGFGPGGPDGPWGGHNEAHKNPKAIRAGGNITIYSGSLTLSTSYDGGEGVESKQSIVINGGDIVCHTYDDCINATERIVVNGGRLFCLSTGNDAIDCNAYNQGAVYINGGIVLAFSSRGNPEEGIDSDFAPLHISGGYLFTIGGTMGPEPSVPTSATAIQPTCCLTGIELQAEDRLCVADADGKALFTLQIPASLRRSWSVCSAPDFRPDGTYTFHILRDGSEASAAKAAADDGWQGFVLGGIAPTISPIRTVTFTNQYIRE